MNEPKVNVEQLLEGILEIKSVCAMATKQANAIVKELSGVVEHIKAQAKFQEAQKQAEMTKKVAEKIEKGK